MDLSVDRVKLERLRAIHVNGMLEESHSLYYIGGQPGALNNRRGGTYKEVDPSFSWIRQFSQGARPGPAHDGAVWNPGYAHGVSP